jgi:predicted dehydrogenase
MLAGAKAEKIDATAIRPNTAYYARTDNFVATFGFADGSAATLTYTALGSPEFPKEQIEVFSEGRVYSVDDYKRLSSTGSGGPKFKSAIPEKGHREELIAFADAIRAGGAWPIPLWQQLEAMRMAFEVESRLVPKGA